MLCLRFAKIIYKKSSIHTILKYYLSYLKLNLNLKIVKITLEQIIYNINPNLLLENNKIILNSLRIGYTRLAHGCLMARDEYNTGMLYNTVVLL